MLNTAVVGVGGFGKHHARVYSSLENSNLVAVCDKNINTVKEIASKYKVPYYTDYHKMLQSENIDALTLSVPASLHYKLSKDILENYNLHLLIEKPIASTVDEAKEILNLAKKSNSKIMVGHLERFNPVTKVAKEILNEEKIDPILVSSIRMGINPGRAVDVGVALDLAVHDIDIVTHFFDKKPKRIYSEIVNRKRSEHDDYAEVLLNYGEGTIGRVSANRVASKKIRKFYVINEEYFIEANYTTQDIFITKNAEMSDFEGYGEYLLKIGKGDVTRPHVEKDEPLKLELDHFIDSIENNKEPMINGKEATNSLAIVLAALKSGRENQAIKFNGDSFLL